MIAQNDELAPPYGALSALIKDHIYVVSGGNIYTTPWVSISDTVRRSVSIFVTAPGKPLDLQVGKHRGKYEAAIVRPMVTRGVRADNVRLVAFLVDANHPRFAEFRTTPANGFLAIARDVYAPFEAALDAAYHGKLDPAGACKLHEDVIEATLKCLPPAPPIDPRVERIVALLRQNPNYRLKDLASAVGLSTSRMSHLFTQSMGLSLRSYLLWFKMYLALDMAQTHPRLTDAALAAGFVDLAHLSREFQRAFGVSLSYFRDESRVKVFDYRSSVATDKRS